MEASLICPLHSLQQEVVLISNSCILQGLQRALGSQNGSPTGLPAAQAAAKAAGKDWLVLCLTKTLPAETAKGPGQSEW